MKADLYENFTDVDGIFAAHPGVVHEPHSIPELTYKEMRELAYAASLYFMMKPSSLPIVVRFHSLLKTQITHLILVLVLFLSTRVQQFLSLVLLVMTNL